MRIASFDDHVKILKISIFVILAEAGIQGA
jgi:hypothetical protein